jgi:cytochrome c peroxidase
MPVHRGAFKVPTLRNIALTAPYMHNGAFKTLEKVVDFYDGGGALGSGRPADPNAAFGFTSSVRWGEAGIAGISAYPDRHIWYCGEPFAA